MLERYKNRGRNINEFDIGEVVCRCLDANPFSWGEEHSNYKNNVISSDDQFVYLGVFDDRIRLKYNSGYCKGRRINIPSDVYERDWDVWQPNKFTILLKGDFKQFLDKVIYKNYLSN